MWGHNGKKNKSNYRVKEFACIWKLWDSEALHVELGIIIWGHTKYLFEGNDENENDAKFYSKKLWYYDFSPGGRRSTYMAQMSHFPLKSLPRREMEGVRGRYQVVIFTCPKFCQSER